MDRIRSYWRLGTKDQSYFLFNPKNGFQVDVVFVKMPGKGKGRQFISKVNALRSTLVMARKHERQTGVVMNDLARLDQVWRTYSSRQWKGCYQNMCSQIKQPFRWLHIVLSLPKVKKVDVTSWKCHRLPWNCG